MGSVWGRRPGGELFRLAPPPCPTSPSGSPRLWRVQPTLVPRPTGAQTCTGPVGPAAHLGPTGRRPNGRPKAVSQITSPGFGGCGFKMVQINKEAPVGTRSIIGGPGGPGGAREGPGRAQGGTLGGPRGPMGTLESNSRNLVPWAPVVPGQNPVFPGSCALAAGGPGSERGVKKCLSFRRWSRGTRIHLNWPRKGWGEWDPPTPHYGTLGNSAFLVSPPDRKALGSGT